MCCLSYPTAFAHVVLTLSSAWAIVQAYSYCYALLGFGLYFFIGLLGIFVYGVSSSSLGLYHCYSQVLLWAQSLSLPLFVVQLFINTGTSQALALYHFILPILYILTVQYLKKYNGFILDFIHTVYLSFLIYISLINGYNYGVSTAISFALAFYAIGTSGTVRNVPCKDLFSYALSFSEYFLVRTLQGI